MNISLTVNFDITRRRPEKASQDDLPPYIENGSSALVMDGRDTHFPELHADAPPQSGILGG